MPETSVTVPLFGDKDFYAALKIAERFNFKLSYHIADGKFWGSIQDWLIGLTGSKRGAQLALDHFLKSDTYDQLSLSKRQLTRDLDYVASDGKTYQTAHGSEYLLYLIANHLRATKSRPQIAAIKAYLAETGVIVGEMVRDPEGAAIKLLNLPDNATTRKELKDIRRATDSGYSWLEAKERNAARQALRDANVRIGALRKGYGVVTGQHHAALNALDFRNGVQVTSEQWKRQHGVKKDVLEHLSTLDLMSLIYAKEATADKYAKRGPKTYTEMVDIGNEVQEECDRFRRISSRIFPARFLQAPTKTEQKKLKGQN